MGERRLGEQPIQESWDLALGTHQRALIEFGYEGISIEQVTEQRLRRAAYGPRATTAAVLEAVENATLYLRNRRLADELGSRPWKSCPPNAASTAHRRCCAGRGGCWPTTAPASRCCCGRPGRSWASSPAKTWVPPWRGQPEPDAVLAVPGPDAGQGLALLAAYPATGEALEVLLRHTNSIGS
jgi:hypothetical protein